MSNPKIELERTKSFADRMVNAKENTDNKIVSFGGSPSTNFADVPNKIKEMIASQEYLRVAEGTYKESITIQGKSQRHPEPKVVWKDFSIPLGGLDFEPKRILLFWKELKFDFRYAARDDYLIISIINPDLDSARSNSQKNAMGQLTYKNEIEWKIPTGAKIYIKSMSKEEVILSTATIESDSDYTGGSKMQLIGPIEWTALG